MRNSKRLLVLTVAAALAGTAAQPCSALFGFGRKKEDPVKTGDPKDLPGLDVRGMDTNQPPSMAQEAEKAKSGSREPYVSEHETAVGDHPSPVGRLPSEVVIRGRGHGKLQNTKPMLSVDVDPFESIRPALEPDQDLLLAESPLAVVWRRTHPEFLKNERVIRPWLTAFSERPGIVFRPLDQLSEVLGRRLTEKESKGFQWSLTIADEDGKVFQHYEGSRYPPEELLWSGQNEQGEWMKAGAAYSPVYMFTDPGGTPYTRVGKPLRLRGIMHQERSGLHISLDSQFLFGQAKNASRVTDEGMTLVRSAADLIKRRHPGIPIRVQSYAASKDLAESQARDIERYLIKELMLLPQDISIDSLRTTYTEQRVEIVLLNR